MMTGNFPDQRFDHNCVSKSSYSSISESYLWTPFTFPFQVKEYLRKEFERHGYAANDTHHEVMVEDIFQKEDEDNDGYISAREFTYKHDEL